MTVPTARRSAKPRLLFLCQTLPYPPDGGVNIRTYHIMRLLACDYEITALCFYRRSDRTDDQAVQSGVEGLSRFADVEAFPIPQEYSAPRLLWDHGRSVARGRAYTYYAYQSREYEARLSDLLAAERFSIVHADSLDLAYYLPRMGRLPVCCTHHNIESALLRRRAQGEASWVRRSYLSRQATLVDRLERSWYDRVALNVAVSPHDAEHIGRVSPSARTCVVPNGVDVDTFRPGPLGDDGLVFVGGANWFPNRDALAHFSTEILPFVREQHEGISVRWVGRSSEEDRDRYNREFEIDLTGYVDDVRPYIQRAACYVVPLRVGGGTRLKILDAWAMGKAVVSTSVGCEGLAAVDGQNILIRDDPREFASAVSGVLGDQELRRRLGEGARKTAEEMYSWDRIGAGLLENYQRVLEAGAGLPRKEARVTTGPAEQRSR